MNRVSLFTKNSENITLLFPLFCVPLLIWEFFIHGRLTKMEHAIGMYVASTLFLNHLHVYFTFSLFFLPEIKNWRSAYSPSLTKYVFRICMLFLIFTGLVLAYGDLLGLNKYVVLVAGLFAILYNLHHALWQFHGLARLYVKDQSKIPFYEELLTRFIFYAVVVRFVFKFSPAHLADPYASSIFLIDKLIFGLSVLAVIGLIYLAFKQFKVIRTNKIFYVPRFFIFILAPDLSLSLAAIAAIHGIEYLFVFLKMKENSCAIQKVKNKVLVSAIVLASLGLLAISFRYEFVLSIFNEKKESLPMFVQVLTSFAAACSFIHFYLDGQLFKFSNPQSKQFVLPLLNTSRAD